MPPPIIEFYKGDDSVLISSIDYGNVNKNTTGNKPIDALDTPIIVWNDRAGGSGADDATQVDFTSKDGVGGDAGAIVTQAWMGVRPDGVVNAGPIYDDAETTFTQVGGESARYSIQKAAFMKDIPAAGGKKVYFELSPPAGAPSGNAIFIHRFTYVY